MRLPLTSNADGRPNRDRHHPFRRLGSSESGEETHSGQWHRSEEAPLADERDEVAVEGKAKKARQRLARLDLFRRRKEDKPESSPRTRIFMQPWPIPEGSPGTQDPFGDENAIDWDVTSAHAEGGERMGVRDDDDDDEMDTHEDGLSSADPPSGRYVAFPSLAATRPRGATSESPPTTPMRSPRSTRSRRTPSSAKSWLSEVSNASSLHRKHARRKARLSLEPNPQLRSMRKSVQVLGPEAAGAVVRGTSVSPNKLRYKDFGRQMRDCMMRFT